MNKKYIKPVIEISRFLTEDIITSSNISGGNENDSTIPAVTIAQADTPRVNDFGEYFG